MSSPPRVRPTGVLRRLRNAKTLNSFPDATGLAGAVPMSYFAMMPNVSLTPELEAFAARCVASGRYANVSEVARAALRLLQQAEQQRQDFLAMLRAAEAEGEGEGFAGADALAAELDAAIRDAAGPQA